MGKLRIWSMYYHALVAHDVNSAVYEDAENAGRQNAGPEIQLRKLPCRHSGAAIV